MLGECHAHMIMDGVNYKAAVALHKEKVCEEAVRGHLEACRKAGIRFVRAGGDARGGSALAKKLAAMPISSELPFRFQAHTEISR